MTTPPSFIAMLRALLLFDGRAALEKDLRLVNLFVDEVKAWLRESTNDSTLKLAKAFMVTVSLPPLWTMPIHVEEGRREKTAEKMARKLKFHHQLDRGPCPYSEVKRAHCLSISLV
jgi:hypothetical protein